jgi:hypothetical protein
MNQSYQPCLYVPRQKTEPARFLRAIMLPFEVLNRERWSAPWKASCR